MPLERVENEGEAFRRERLTPPQSLWDVTPVMPLSVLPFPPTEIANIHRMENSMSTDTETPTINADQLRGFDKPIREIAMECVNDHGVPYNLNRNLLTLYPLDGSRPMGVHPHGNTRTVNGLRAWARRHVTDRPRESQLVEIDDFDPTPDESSAIDSTPTPREVADIVGAQPDLGAEWRPYVNSADEVDSRFQQRAGGRFRCVDCVDLEHQPFETDNKRSLAAHWRMKHDRSALMDAQETRDKATETKRSRRYERDINLAIELLTGTLGKTPPSEEVLALRAENADLKAQLALIREAAGLS